MTRLRTADLCGMKEIEREITTCTSINGEKGDNGCHYVIRKYLLRILYITYIFIYFFRVCESLQGDISSKGPHLNDPVSYSCKFRN